MDNIIKAVNQVGIREYTEARKEANKRWDAENLSQIAVRLPKDLVAEFKAKCNAEGISQASIFREAIEEFLGK